MTNGTIPDTAEQSANRAQVFITTGLLLMLLIATAKCGGGGDGPREWVRNSDVAGTPSDREINRSGPNER